MPSQEKTEAPSDQRRRRARDEGQTAKSVEINSVVALLGGLLVLRYSMGSFYDGLSALMRRNFQGLSTTDLTPGAALQIGTDVGIAFLRMMAPLFGVVILLALASNLAQSGLLFSTKLLAPDINRINPARGFKRMFSGQALQELLKALAKLGIVGWVAYGVLAVRFGELLGQFGGAVSQTGQLMADIGYEVVLKCGMALLVLAAVDYAYQRWNFERNLRMTKQELREEMRNQEGNPQVKGHMRRQQRRLSSQRMMQSVPQATVVVTNPTHLAIALEYRADQMAAPKVTAKGADLTAERIRDVARANRVPIVENKALAWALFRTTEIGQTVPSALYQAVAEVLAFVFRLDMEAQRRASVHSRVLV